MGPGSGRGTGPHYLPGLAPPETELEKERFESPPPIITPQPTEIEVSVSLKEFEKVLTGRHELLSEIPLETQEEARSLLGQLVKAKAKEKNVTLTKEMIEEIANLLLFIAKKTEESLP